MRDNFRREHAKISKTTTGSEARDDPPHSSWKYYEQLQFLVKVFPSRKMQTNILPVSNQVSEPSDVTNEEEDNVMADDNVIDIDLEVSISDETQKGEVVVGVTQKDSPAGTNAKAFRKPDIQIKRKMAKSDAINQLLSLEKKKIEQLEKMHESKKSYEELEKDEDYHFLMSLLPHLREVRKRRKLAIRTCLQKVLMKEEMTEAVQSPSSTRSYPTSPSSNTVQLNPHPASYVPAAYPSELSSSLYLMTTSVNQFSDNLN